MCYTFTIEISNRELEVTVDVDGRTYSDGIGSYEFWGHKSYDKGNQCVEIDDIRLVEAYWTDNGNEIKNLNEKYKFYNIIDDYIKNDIMNEVKEELLCENTE